MKNQEIPEKYKIYKGRIFLLRKKNLIPTTINKIIGREKPFLHKTKEIFGEAVFIYDETNTKIQVSTLNGIFVWIPKNCLLKEIEMNSNTIKINDLITDIINTKLSDEKKAVITQLLRNLI